MSGVACAGMARHMWNGPAGKRFFQTFHPAGSVRSYVRPHVRALASSYFISTPPGFCDWRG
jgi:hypothetical protein